jgi:hypothetical protein
MAYADFLFYKDIFKGLLITDKTVFESVSERASEYIDMVTFFRIDKVKDISTENLIKKCVCAIADAYYIYEKTQLGNETKTSESIGQYSVSWVNPVDSLEKLTGGSFPDYLRKICIKYLGDTGLMFRGYIADVYKC